MRRLGDPLGVELTDDELAAEVQLLTMLIVAANSRNGPLSMQEVDRVLFGV